MNKCINKEAVKNKLLGIPYFFHIRHNSRTETQVFKHFEGILLLRYFLNTHVL